MAFVEGLWEDYRNDPSSVPEEWRNYFQGFGADGAGTPNGSPAPEADPRYVAPRPDEPVEQAEVRADVKAAIEPLPAAYSLQDRVDKLVRNYRVRGHMIAHMDPLGLPRPSPPELDADFYGLTAAEMDQHLSDQTLSGCNLNTPRTIIERLRETYCRSIGVQFMHIDDLTEREWLQKRMEGTANRLHLSPGRQLRILTRLTDATIFEEFIQKKFVGAKSFSLEGCESLIPLLDLAIERAGDSGANEIVHRHGAPRQAQRPGERHGQEPAADFPRVRGPSTPHLHAGRGDVKYHLGYSSDWKTAKGANVHLSLCVQSVALGVREPGGDRAHARQAGPQPRHATQARTDAS